VSQPASGKPNKRHWCPECGGSLGLKDVLICATCVEKADRAMADVMSYSQAAQVVDMEIRKEISVDARENK